MNFGYKWTVDPMQLLKTVNASAMKKTEIVAEEVFDGVVEHSPVDTGSFRASWTADIGKPTFVYKEGGSSRSPQKPPNWPGLKLKTLDKIHVCNGAPYARKLEDGHSGQAPHGIVAVTLAGL